VQALAAGRAGERDESERLEVRAQRVRARHDVLPRHGGIGIEVEHDAIGPVEPVGAAAPGVELERAELHERDEPLDVVDHHVEPLAPALLHGHAMDHGGQALGRVLLVEARAAGALRTAHDRQRAAGDVR
jgi:hypothetical protein